MTINDLFGLANKFRTEGNIQMAVQLWNEALKADPFFGPAHVNLADIARSQGNFIAEKNHLNQFLDCPITGRTLNYVQQAVSRITELEKPPVAQPVQAPK